MDEDGFPCLGDEDRAKGIRARISTFARHHVNSKLANGKTCGDYVHSILAKREALLDGFDEAIMLDTKRLVSECTAVNFFVVRDGKIERQQAFFGAVTGADARYGRWQTFAD